MPRRADMSLVKTVVLEERWDVRYTFDVYNLTNTPGLTYH
jgi:hypothetical protein